MIPTSDLIRLADEHRRDLERRAAAHRLARTVRRVSIVSGMFFADPTRS